MSIREARTIAESLGGEPVQVADEAWLILFERADGRVVTLSETSVEEYADREAFAARHCYLSIDLK